MVPAQVYVYFIGDQVLIALIAVLGRLLEDEHVRSTAARILISFVGGGRVLVQQRVGA